MIKEINHISFTVSDLEKSIDFYSNIIGLKLIDKSERDGHFSEQVTGIKGAHLLIAYMKGPNCSIELIQYLSPKGKKLDTSSNNIGSAHVCFIVKDFDKMVKNLKENHVKFAGVPSIIPAGPNKGRKVLYFKDPDSNTLEFFST